MTKRASGQFQRKGKDYYPTRDPKAVVPLIPHLPRRARYVEPCAGDGALIRLLEPWGMACVGASDIDPQGPGIVAGDALKLRSLPVCDLIITNPPWKRPLLHALIRHLTKLAPCWLLFDSDWAICDQALEFDPKSAKPGAPRCSKIVAVGRVEWMLGEENHQGAGFDNASWYLFDRRHYGPTQFFFRRMG
jgi:hypothetical protein